MRRPSPNQLIAGLVPLGLLIVAVPATVLSVLYAPTFEVVRRTAVEHFLGRAIDMPVTVKGTIRVGFDWAPTISITDLTVAKSDLPPELMEMSAKSLSLNLPLLPLLAGQVQLNSLVVEGLKVAMDIPRSGGSENENGADAVELVGEFLRSGFADDLSLRDAAIRYADQESGFDLLYTFDEIATRPQADGGVHIKGTGQLNGEQWKLGGHVDPPGGDADRRTIVLAVAHAGLKNDLAGTYHFDKHGDTVDMTVTSAAPTLKQFFAVYGVSSDLEGSGDLVGRLTGRLDALELMELALKLAFESGDVFQLTGTVADIAAGTGIDLVLTGSFARAARAAGEAQPIYDIGITGFSGHIGGSLGGVLAQDFHVQTSSVTASLRDIGPITAERLYKDRDGHLGLYDVLILAGDPKRPNLRVAGTVKDIFKFQGVDLKGEIDFLTAGFLDLAAEDHAADLGHLSGNAAISDADGSLGIEALTASVKDSSLLQLSIDLVFDDLAEGNELKFAIHLDIPRFQPFAAALGSQIEEVGAVKFDSTITGSDERIVIAGTALVGETTIDGSLAGALSQGKPVLSGEISTPLLRLADLLKLASINAVYQANDDEQDADLIDYSKIWETLLVDMKIKVAAIAGGGNGASNIEGRITYLAGIVGLDPLTLTFLGGKASANGNIDTTGSEPSFALKGNVGSLPIGAILKEMQVTYPVSGALNVTYDVSGSGSSAAQIPRSLNGGLTISLRDGWIGTGLLDLAGMSLPAWLLTRVQKGNQATLVCAVAPFTFNNGRGTTQGLVLETRNVEIAGVGFIDFRQSAIDLRFKPQALQRQFIRTAQPFAISGPLQNPRVTLGGNPAVGAVAGVVAFPFNILNNIVMPGANEPGRVPCRLTQTPGRPDVNAPAASPPQQRGPLGLFRGQGAR
ncbi:MAG: AsmA family protein [Methyloceanibacter sp.]